MEGDNLRHVTTGNTAAPAATRHHHVIQMTRGPQGHPKDTQKTPQCARTLQDALRQQEDVVSLDLQGTTHQSTLGIRRSITTASAPPGRGTHIGLHAASPSSQWTCRDNQQVQTGHLYTDTDLCKYCVSFILSAFILSFWILHLKIHCQQKKGAYLAD